MCGLFGFCDYGVNITLANKTAWVNRLATEASVRGKHATGVAYVKEGEVVIEKKAVPGKDFNPEIMDDIKVIMGHTRYATKGNVSENYNNHPFPGTAGDTSFALAHNGVLYNDDELRKKYKLEKPTIETDSYIAVQLINHEGILDFETLKFVGENVQGSFTFSILDKNNNLYLMKGDNPLVIYHFKELGAYVYASTETIIKNALSDKVINFYKDQLEIIEPKEGTIIKISNTGEMTTFNFVKQISSGKNWYEYGNSTINHHQIAKLNNFIPNEEDRKELIRRTKLYGYDAIDLIDLLEHGYTATQIFNFLQYGTIDNIINQMQIAEETAYGK